jgi:hypothetical protein
VVNHDVVRLDIAVHDALGVTEVKSFEQLEKIEADVKVGEFRVQCLELGVLWSQSLIGTLMVLTLTNSVTMDGVLD